VRREESARLQGKTRGEGKKIRKIRKIRRRLLGF